MNEVKKLKDLVRQIKTHHELVQDFESKLEALRKKAIENAIACGQRLIEAKEAVGHGHWEKWFAKNFRDYISKKTAQNYMRLCNANRQHVADLYKAPSLRQAYVAAGVISESLGDAPDEEWYTPACAVLPIIEYIPKDAVVWTPFDTSESQYVKIISRTHKVVYSHIAEGKDFFDYEPNEWHVLVSNPPFSGKTETFKRALSFGKPFALLMNLQWLHDGSPFKTYGEKQLQLMMFDERIRFIPNDGGPINKPDFASGYFCWNFLPNDLICKTLATDFRRTLRACNGSHGQVTHNGRTKEEIGK